MEEQIPIETRIPEVDRAIYIIHALILWFMTTVWEVKGKFSNRKTLDVRFFFIGLYMFHGFQETEKKVAFGVAFVVCTGAR